VKGGNKKGDRNLLGCRRPGLPDGIFSNQKNPDLGKFWRVLQWKIWVCILHGHLEYYTAFWNILWPFGIVCGHLVHFSVLVCFDQEKSGIPGAVFCGG
jgi:hypothetical protein